MAKRLANEDVADGAQAFAKRQKLSFSSKPEPGEEIKSAKQLRQLLTFQQNAGHLKHAIQSLKLFLDSFSTSDNENGRQIVILKEYLESQIPLDNDSESAPVLQDILKAWEYAAQSNDDSLMSAVPAVLALLFKIISNNLDLLKYGLKLGKILLQKPLLELIGRGLLASKNKDFVISPVLRLLRELSIFDGGIHAKYVFRAREYTFKGLARNLNIRFTGSGVEDPRKPSVRTNALRFLLPLFKFLPTDSKQELLHQRDIISGLTRDIRDDPPFIVRDILDVLKMHIMLDEQLPRDAKSKIINTTTLVRIAALYQYTHMEMGDVGNEEVLKKGLIDDLAHNFLIMACTSLNMGVLIRQSGFYPRGIDPDDTLNSEGHSTYIDLGLDSIEWMSKFTEQIPVRNTILSEFITNLRPWSNIKQSQLLISIFNASPELIADYFFSKKDFSFEPKLTGTWMGYSAFIFATLQQPVPKFFGHHACYGKLPPPTSIVLENILPRPLSQKVLNKCLNHAQDPLVTFFVVRILCVALQKLQTILQMYQEASSGSLTTLWAEAATRLVDRFCSRCPAISHVISAYRRMSEKDLIQKEAVTKLLVLYYEIIPQLAMETNSGAPAAVIEFLQSSDMTRYNSEDGALRALELENLFTFAHSSPGVKWFSKSKGLSISPFMAMIKLSAEAPSALPLFRLRSVLLSLVEENQIFQTQTVESALDTFIISLRNNNTNKLNSDSLYEFLDDCISRCASTPAKYIFSLEQIHAELKTDHFCPVSLLLLTILEQWPFQIDSASSFTLLEEKSRLIARYLAASISIREDKDVIRFLLKRFILETPANSTIRNIIEGSLDLVEKISLPDTTLTSRTRGSDNQMGPVQETAKDIFASVDTFTNPPEDHSFLVKWMNKEIEEVIENGYAASLIMLLTSNHLGVRKEALTNLSKLALKLKESSYEEKDQVWLLMSELIETARVVVDEQPLPAVISAFASQSIGVLKDPIHCLFPKINKFLSQGPIWQIDKVPLMHRILDEAPTLDEAGYLERSWLFTYMLDGLRSKADLDIYRKRLVFEKLLSSYNAHLGRGLREQILKIMAKASSIEGGSTTLVTRFSALTWLQVQDALAGGSHLGNLDQRILASCDQERVRIWSKGVLLERNK